MWTYILAIPVVVAAVYDFRFRLIPNRLTAPTLVLGITLSTVWHGASGLLQSVLGIVVGLALLWIPFAMGGMGAGDVKLLAAMGAWLGPWNVFQVALLGAIVGAVMAIYTAYKKKILYAAVSGLFAKGQSRSGESVPYGVALAAGLLFFWLK